MPQTASLNQTENLKFANRLAHAGKKLFLFLLSGIPGFLLAFPLNFILVDSFHVSKALSYAIVLVVQVHLGYYLSRMIAFHPSQDKPLWRQYVEFMGAVAVFRGLDWLFYTFCVEALRFPLVIAGRDCYYLAYQLANVIIFSLAKFVFCKRAIEGAPK